MVPHIEVSNFERRFLIRDIKNPRVLIFIPIKLFFYALVHHIGFAILNFRNLECRFVIRYLRVQIFIRIKEIFLIQRSEKTLGINFCDNSSSRSQKNRCAPNGINARFWYGKKCAPYGVNAAKRAKNIVVHNK